jgi:SRSO17 transposase
MVGLRLFLPESWTSDPARLDRAGVPDGHRAYRTKPEIALAEIDRVRAAGVRFGCVLADAGYGLSAPFRQALTERGLTWAVGIPFKQKVYPADDDLPRCRTRPSAPAPYPQRQVGRRASDAGDSPMAHDQLASRHEGTIIGALCRHARARR